MKTIKDKDILEAFKLGDKDSEDETRRKDSGGI